MKTVKDTRDLYTFIEKYFYHIIGFIVFTLIIMTATLYGQEGPTKDLYISKVNDNETGSIKDLSIKTYSGNVYINWKIGDLNNDCQFLIQRSKDGKDFETVGIKQGIKTNIGSDLLYSYVDQQPENNTYYYRVTQIFAEGDIGQRVSEMAFANLSENVNIEVKKVIPPMAYEEK